MARTLKEAEALISKLETALDKQKQEMSLLKTNCQKQEDENNDIMINFNLAIVDTTEDMRIVNSLGSTEHVFAGAGEKFERGKNLLKMVYMTTRNSKEKAEEQSSADDIKAYEDREDLEDVIIKFTESKRDEREIKIIGEREDGEIFLMIWMIKRRDNYFRSYFKIIPSNTIIDEISAKHKAEQEANDKKMYEMLAMVRDGVIMMNQNQKILFMNNQAKELILSNNKLLRNAPVEGRFFHEIFVNDDNDSLRMRQEHNGTVLRTGNPVEYDMKTQERKLNFVLNPIKNSSNKVVGIFLLCKNNESNGNVARNNAQIGMQLFDKEQRRTPDKIALKMALRELTEDKKKLAERVKELETNHNWHMKNSRQYQSMVKKLYTYIANIPLPMVVINVKDSNYELVNLAMEKMLRRDRKEILGKKDVEILPGDLGEYLNSTVEELLISGGESVIDHSRMKGKQILIKDSNDEKTHIVRIVTDFK